MLNQGNNKDKEHTPNQMVEVMNQEEMIKSTKVITDENMQGKLQVDEPVAAKQNQERNIPKTNEQARTSMVKQHNNGEKVIWKVKDKSNPNATKQRGRRKSTKQYQHGGRNNSLQIPDPAPPTLTQSLATRLRANQLKNATPLIIDQPIITTRQGYPSITFSKEDFLGKMLGRCKYTLVRKFFNVMPKMEAIKKSFIAQTQLTGGVKIAHFNSRHIYIDLDNEADHISVWTKQKMCIAGQSMKLQMWTPIFKLTEETPIVLIWITLPELPWHCHYMDILTPLLSLIGKVLYLDSATMQKTRGSVAKVRVQIDITKERPQHVWLGFSEKDPNLGKWQIIEYEDVPPYYIYCKHQGHVIGECPLKEKDEEIKKNKDQEAANKIQEKQNIQNLNGIQPQAQTKENMQPYQQATDWKHTEKNNTNNEEQWQVQKQQANSIKEQQKLQQSGMTSNTPVNVNEKSSNQISTLPSLVIVDVDDHCDDNDIPAPVSPLVVAAKVIGRRLDVQEKTFNLQEGDPRGRVVNHAPATTPNDTPQHQKKVHPTKEKGRDTPNQ
ncbi:hypothetical protein H5410_027581 [Solanum commersonii]|uniref:DUF4283 domain-containing protein n=1 Tax=Solanum commersonii TaxID=4109 RepID=A0A9J5YZK7_SOLCO|nr:hypothetical protein H5410_027581 [Solanum commersonii]